MWPCLLYTSFLFWAIAVGIVLAAGMIPLAIIGSVIIGLIILIFANKKTSDNPYIIVISCADHDSELRAKEFINQQVSRAVIKSKSAQKGAIELNYEIRLKDDRCV